MSDSYAIKTEISAEDVASLLCSGFEGGSNYWYTILEYYEPNQYEFRTDEKEIFRHIDYPMNPGGYLMIGDLEDGDFEEDEEGNEVYKGKQYRLDKAALQRGLEVMAKKYPRNFADVLNENADAETGDVFLQCCIFGELIYG